jgi:hypothetical protein
MSDIIRPEWDEFVGMTSGGYLLCNCGRVLQTFEAVREHWQAGHFDYVRTTITEVDDE